MCIRPMTRAELLEVVQDGLGAAVGQRVEHELPPVAAAGDEALHDPEGRVDELALELVGPAERRDARRSRAR